MNIFVVLGVLFAAIALGLPIAYSLALAALAGALWIGIPIEAVMLQISSGVSKFAMLTIPFFVLAGAIMAEGGMARRLVAFANLIVGLLRRDNWWILLSNGDVRDEGPVQPWSDAIPFGRTYYETAPERCIWGSDWPHIAYNRRGLESPDEKALVGLLESFLPDQAARQAVLVDNPARLYGF